jgi:hypothetical protein
MMDSIGENEKGRELSDGQYRRKGKELNDGQRLNEPDKNHECTIDVMIMTRTCT